MADMTVYRRSSGQDVSHMSFTRPPLAVSSKPNGSPSLSISFKNTDVDSNIGNFEMVCMNESVSKNCSSSVDESPEDLRVSSVTDRHQDTSGVVSYNGVTLHLVNAPLWEQFSKIGTEMIITKKGRRLFPVPTLTIEGLDPQLLYDVQMTILPVDKMIYKYLNGVWLPHRDRGGGGLTFSAGVNSYLHPSSPNTGSFWMKEAIVFSGLKICNNVGLPGMIVLQSMRKYRMTIVIKELGATRGISFPMELTDFVAVTQYQNEQVTKLKIEHNPFANAFRGPNKIKDKNGGLTAQREQETSPNKEAYIPVLPPSHPSFLFTQQEYKIPFPDPRDYDQNIGKSFQSPYSLAGYEQWSRHQSNVSQVTDVLPHHGDSPDSSYRTKFNSDFASRSPQSALSVPNGPQSEFPISRGDPMDDAVQLNEYMHSSSQIRQRDAISFIRKRRSEHESEFSKDNGGVSPRKMSQSSQIRVKHMGLVNQDFRNSNSFSKDRQTRGCQTSDSDSDIIVMDNSLEGESFDHDSQWSDVPTERAKEVPTDMTIKARTSHLEGSPVLHPNIMSQGSPKVRRPGVVLKNRDIWCTTNEVVVSAEGRPMFPFISLSVSGLEPRRLYYMALEITMSSKWLYNFSDHEWRPCMEATSGNQVISYQHPENPKYGHGWGEGVHFDRLRLSTTRQGKNMLKVQLRRQYYPVLMIRTEDQKWTYVLKDAMFITVSIDRTPLLLGQGDIFSADDDQDIQQDVYPQSHATQRKQSNPRKMKSNRCTRRHTSRASMTTAVHELAGSVAGAHLSTEDTTTVSYASRALQGHDIRMLNQEESEVYDVEQLPL